MGFLDDAFGEDAISFEAELRARASRLAQDPELRAMLREKHERRLDDESTKPLASYRAEELERMKVNFFGPDPAYHEARRRFVFKGAPLPREAARQASPPTRENVAWSARSRRANGSARGPRPELGENPALTREAWGARLLGMLWRKAAAVGSMRDR
jgi:putative two-component system hydrogenase maturation factor HypX/HoxX